METKRRLTLQETRLSIDANSVNVGQILLDVGLSEGPIQAAALTLPIKLPQNIQYNIRLISPGESNFATAQNVVVCFPGIGGVGPVFNQSTNTLAMYHGPAAYQLSRLNGSSTQVFLLENYPGWHDNPHLPSCPRFSLQEMAAAATLTLQYLRTQNPEAQITAIFHSAAGAGALRHLKEIMEVSNTNVILESPSPVYISLDKSPIVYGAMAMLGLLKPLTRWYMKNPEKVIENEYGFVNSYLIAAALHEEYNNLQEQMQQAFLESFRRPIISQDLQNKVVVTSVSGDGTLINRKRLKKFCDSAGIKFMDLDKHSHVFAQENPAAWADKMNIVIKSLATLKSPI